MAGRHARQGGNPTLSDYEVARAVVHGQQVRRLARTGRAGRGRAEGRSRCSGCCSGRRRAGSCRCRPGRRGSAAAAPPPPPLRPRRNRPPSTRPAKSSTRASASPVTPPAWPTRKFGDKAAWEPHIKTGMDAMVKVAMQAAHAAQGRRGHRHGRRHPRGRAIHGGRGQVVRRSAPPEGGISKKTLGIPRVFCIGGRQDYPQHVQGYWPPRHRCARRPRCAGPPQVRAARHPSPPPAPAATCPVARGVAATGWDDSAGRR